MQTGLASVAKPLRSVTVLMWNGSEWALIQSGKTDVGVTEVQVGCTYY